MLYSLLDSTITLFSPEIAEGLNFLGKIVQWIVEWPWLPTVGLGIVLFTLILKIITLPLDIYSKASMRKNSLKMEKMRPQLEKLQKQYQNDQQTYNAKMMELYKKNGYSMFGACLPMIVTIAVFMIVMGAFSDYSNYANLDVYREMALQYNSAVLRYAPDIENEALLQADEIAYGRGEKQADGKTPYYRYETYDASDALIYVRVERTLLLEAEGLSDAQLAAYDWYNTDPAKGPVVQVEQINAREYFVKTAAVLESTDEAVQAAVAVARETLESASDDAIAKLAMQTIGRNAAEQSYRNYNSRFLWVKNIWTPDTSYRHPIELDSGTGTQAMGADLFDEITYNLGAEKSAANGYYILILISIGTMFLSQFIISKSQKAQNELQTADGRGKKMQKTMMIAMPIIFGFFSFFYSAAFSIYMIVSNIFSIASTLLINFFIDRKFKRIEEQEIQEKYNKRIPQTARNTDNVRKGGKAK